MTDRRRRIVRVAATLVSQDRGDNVMLILDSTSWRHARSSDLLWQLPEAAEGLQVPIVQGAARIFHELRHEVGWPSSHGRTRSPLTRSSTSVPEIA